MNCYQCGCALSEHDFCTNCGADVALYKRIIYISNRFYNDGLERAGVRDLTGAIMSLRQSLKFNKNNVEARNLLGLVYFETGEVVAALSEWVISKNMRPKKNIADDYINMIQTNQNRLDTINQTIKKYNQALTYCNQDSLDLAVIQLKKVLSLNPKFIRAHQLLALLYINNEEWERAKRELSKCLEIDTNNTATLRYLKEVDEMLLPEEGVKSSPRKKKSEEIVKYQSGNETIIQPVNMKEGRGVTSLLNLGIGLAIGIAIAFFLILPARIQTARAGIDEELRKVSEQSDAKTATIDELQQQLGELQQQNESLQQDMAAYMGTDDGTLQSVESLMRAAVAYLTDPNDVTTVADYLDQIEEEKSEEEEQENSEAFENLYGTLLALVGPQLAESYDANGHAAFWAANYEEAIPLLTKAYQYDPTNGQALYDLANSYYRMGDVQTARGLYQEVIELFPNTEKADKSEGFLAEIEGAEE